MENKINKDDLRIKLCTSSDVKDIYKIQNVVIDNFKENEKGYFLPFKEESYLRIVNDPINDGEIYGAFLNNKMIAWIFLSVSNRMKEIKSYIPDIEGKCADIDGVIVLPEYRGNHLQNMLVEHLEKRAKKLGINNIVAEVTFGNEYSLKNLQSMGYEIKTWYQKDENIKRHILLKRLEGKMLVKEIKVNDYLTKSNLPASDYVINPYVGCPHGCKYCYASFMKRFTGHTEDWGTFIDVKRCDKKISLNKISKKSVFLSSVTDCYNQLEEKYKLTRDILEQLVNSDCYLSISTKSKLILRDIDLLKQIKNLSVSMSINTIDEDFRNDMDNASTIEERLNTLRELYNNGVHTVLFMSPIFPYITEWKEIIEKSKNFVDEYWFENLNLRGQYKTYIMNYIKNKYPKYYNSYVDIYIKNNKEYWIGLANEINDYCQKNNINYINYFYHEELVKKKFKRYKYNYQKKY